MTTVERGVDVGPLELAVAESGQGGRPLMLVHGYTGAANDFADFMGPLADRGWHVVAPDLRGHGASSKPPDEVDYDYHLFVTDLLGLADALGWDRFVLLGHSMGGMIAQVLALDAPERLEALILMDTGHGPLDADPALIELGVSSARQHGMDFVADFMAATDDGPLTTDAWRQKVAEDPSYAERGDRNLRAASPAMFAAMLLQISETSDRIDRLSSIAVPTLVLVGEQDVAFIEASRRMAEVIAGSQLVVLPGGGHSPQVEVPDAWWSAVSSFLDGLY